MGQFYEEIPEFLISWIEQQKVFWVATAPLTGDGHVNVSPKGYDGTFHIVNSRKVWYEDLSGSGIETISHLRENGRITILFNAFEGPPRIARLFGTGTFYEFGTPEYDSLLPPGKRRPGSRAVIIVDVHKVGTSCGFAVPFFDYVRPRPKLLEYYDKREAHDLVEEVDGKCEATPPDGLKEYWARKNSKSIDGLPGLTTAPQSNASHVHCSVEDGISNSQPNRNPQFHASGLGDWKLAVGFSIGVVASAVFGKLAAL